MNATFDLRAEKDLLDKYLAHLPQAEAKRQGELIGRTCDDFRRLRLGESILVMAHTTEWILPWLERFGCQLRAPVRSSHIEALGRWWGWLFQHSLLHDNVLGCFYPCSQVLRQQQPLVLWQNLQRTIACYLEERGPRQTQTGTRPGACLPTSTSFYTVGGPRPSPSRLVAFRHHVRVVFGKGLEARDGRRHPYREAV